MIENNIIHKLSSGFKTFIRNFSARDRSSYKEFDNENIEIKAFAIDINTPSFGVDLEKTDRSQMPLKI